MHAHVVLKSRSPTLWHLPLHELLSECFGLTASLLAVLQARHRTQAHLEPNHYSNTRPSVTCCSRAKSSLVSCTLCFRSAKSFSILVSWVRTLVCKMSTKQSHNTTAGQKVSMRATEVLTNWEGGLLPLRPTGAADTPQEEQGT